ncbi:MAG: DUF3187 family protein, partial [Nitrospirae bacterium]|nr:DUF3187 family protein [Nitrospirota bacterium]
MKRSLFILFLFIVVLMQPAPAGSFDGPLQVRNQFPIFLPLDPPHLESAAVRDSATVTLTHSSVYVIETTSAWTVNMDLELTELDIRLKKTLGARTELGLDIPMIRPTAGFLDRPLDNFHDALGTGDYGRSARPYNEFLYEVLYHGKPVIIPESDKAGIGDVRMTVKRVVSDARPLVSLMANIELPTGDAKTGYGNGSVDAAFAVLVDLDL